MPAPPPPIKIISSTGTNKTIVTSSAPVITLPTPAGSTQRKILRPMSQPLTPETIQQLQSQGLLKTGGVTADGKRIIVVKKSATGMTVMPKIQSTTSIAPTTIVTAARTTPTVTKVTVPNSGSVTAGQKILTCQECKVKPSKFECAGCSKMWYCSKECQEKNWSKHEADCGQTKGKEQTKVKQEIIDEID